MGQEIKKIRVAVLGGGVSNEREVSLSTAKQVMENLDKEKFEPIFYDTKTDLGKLFADSQAGKLDVAFVALHGKGGEDGSMQSMLELAGLRYIGSGILASALGMNKEVSKKLFEKEGIPTAKFTVCQELPKAEQISGKLGWPLVIKPVSGGSSIGVSIIERLSELTQAFSAAKEHDKEVMLEQYIAGAEITVGILGNKDLQVLPVVEICPRNKFFDYKAKYDSDFCDEIAPARISPEAAQKAQDLALKVYRALGCQGFGRVDFILKNNQEPIVLEINTIPGLTPNSLLPKAAKAAGISFPQLLTKVICLALGQE